MNTHQDLIDLMKHRAWTELAGNLGLDPLARPQPIPEDAWQIWALPEEFRGQLEVIAHSGGFRLLSVSGFDPCAMRPAMFALHRRNPEDLNLWWWDDARSLTVAMVSRRPTGGLFIRRLVIEYDSPDACALEQLKALQTGFRLDPSTQIRALRDHVESVLSQEKLTRAFFQGFRALLDTLQKSMIDGPPDAESRHEIALITLLRVVFLYFLQKRAALDNDPRFVMRRWSEWTGRPRSDSFFRGVVRPLFFEALNTPFKARGAGVAGLGELPFLNGGLFDPTPAERAFPDLDWSNEVWSQVLDGHFERFQFVLSESGPDDETHAIDPEMLGKVFEGLMFGDHRQASGSFYTPRDVVRKIVHDTLGAQLEEKSGLDQHVIQAILNGESTRLDIEERQALRAALQDLRILDPAAGTGAFLIEALRVLTRAWETVEATTFDHVGLRRIIHEHLFGVDILTTATRLCELRFWIALLARTPRHAIHELPPLPNLSHRIANGNALIDPLDPARHQGVGSPWALDRDAMARITSDIEAAQSRFLVSHGSLKATLKSEIETLETQAQQTLLTSRIAQLNAKITPFTRLDESKNLFGQNQLTTAQRKTFEALQSELTQVEEALERIGSRRQAGAFSFPVRFAHALGDGGFDLILTNPPWVRTQRIPRHELQTLKARYRAFDSQLWPEAAARGIRPSYGNQVDLANLFVERSLELLKPGGRLGALIPAKFLRSLQGTPLRRILADHCVESIEDFSDGARELFDATTYPAILQIARRPADRRPQIASWNGDHLSRWSLPINTLSTCAPWVLVPPDTHRILRRMASFSTSDCLTPIRGVFTGANSVFIKPEKEWIDLLGQQVRPFLRSITTGRDLTASGDARILWLYDGTKPLQPSQVPGAIRDYFETERERLEARSDHRANGPLWQVFRHRASGKHRVVWRDIAPEIEAVVAAPDAVLMNTAYALECDNREQAEGTALFLNSEPVRAWAYAHAEPARGGWRRHFAWTMREIPLPRDFDDLTRRLPDSAHPDAVVADAYRLNRSDLQLLRGWRRGVSRVTNAPEREAA